MVQLHSALQALQILNREDLICASAMALEMEVNTKTIYRTIDQLGAAGFPIASIKGKNGGYRLLKGHETMQALTNEELALVFFAADVLSSSKDFPYSSQLKIAKEKIDLAIRQKLEPNRAENWQQRIHYYRDGFCLNNLNSSAFRTLGNALAKRHVVRVKYFTMQDHCTKERDIDPYKLIFHNGFWYLIGFCHLRSEVKTFRVDRISEACEAGVSFKYPEDFSLQQYMGNSWGIMRGEPCSVCVRFSPHAADYIREVQWHPTQSLTELPNKEIEFRADLAGTEEFIRWIMSFGKEAELIEPIPLRYEIIERLDSARLQYK